MLRPGDRFELNNKTWRVIHVNASRAHCASESKEQVTQKEWNKKTQDYKLRTYTVTSRDTIDISPNSVVEVLS